MAVVKGYGEQDVKRTALKRNVRRIVCRLMGIALEIVKTWVLFVLNCLVKDALKMEFAQKIVKKVIMGKNVI
jgi:hypothetical protein